MAALVTGLVMMCGDEHHTSHCNRATGMFNHINQNMFHQIEVGAPT